MTELCLWNKGLDTIKQPVYIGDVAAGYYELVKRNAKDVAGKTYQFIGYVYIFLPTVLIAGGYVFGWLSRLSKKRS